MGKKRKTIIKTFKDIGFSINIQTNLKEAESCLSPIQETWRQAGLHPLIVEPSTANHQIVTKFHL